jgi:hypothetical protein
MLSDHKKNAKKQNAEGIEKNIYLFFILISDIYTEFNEVVKSGE